MGSSHGCPLLSPFDGAIWGARHSLALAIWISSTGIPSQVPVVTQSWHQWHLRFLYPAGEARYRMGRTLPSTFGQAMFVFETISPGHCRFNVYTCSLQRYKVDLSVTSRWMVDINDHHTRWSEDIRRYHEGLWRSPAKLFQAGSASMSQLHALPAYTSQLPVAAVAGELVLWPRTPASSFSSDRKKEPVI